eukprot:g15930.t1
MDVLGCVTDCGDLALFLDVLDCVKEGEDYDVTSGGMEWEQEQQREAHTSDGAFRRRPRRGAYSARTRRSFEQSPRFWAQAGIINRRSHPQLYQHHRERRSTSSNTSSGASHDTYGALTHPPLTPPSTFAPRVADVALRSAARPQPAEGVAVPAPWAERTATTTTAAADFDGESKRWFRSGGGDDFDDSKDFDGAAETLQGRVDRGSAAVAGGKTTRFAKRGLVERLFFADGDPDGAHATPVPKEAGAAAPPSSSMATAFANGGGVERNHSQVETDTQPQPPSFPAAACRSTTSDTSYYPKSTMATIVALAAATSSGAGFSSASSGLGLDNQQDRGERFFNGHHHHDQPEAKGDDVDRILGRAPADILAALAAAAAAASRVGFSKSISNDLAASDSEREGRRESAGRALRALVAEIARSSEWTTTAAAAAGIPVAASSLPIHAPAASSPDDFSPLRSASSTLPARAGASSRGGIGTDGDVDGMLNCLSDVSDSDLSTITTAASVAHSQQSETSRSSTGYAASFSGSSSSSSCGCSSLDGKAGKLTGGGAAVDLDQSGTSRSSGGYPASFSKTSTPCSPRQGKVFVDINKASVGGGKGIGGESDGAGGGGRRNSDRKARATTFPHSGVDMGPHVGEGGARQAVDFKVEGSEGTGLVRKIRPSSSSTTTGSGDADMLMRARNQDSDFDSQVVDALVGGARSVERRFRFRRGWSDLCDDNDAESDHSDGLRPGALDLSNRSAWSHMRTISSIAKPCVSVHLTQLRVSADGAAVTFRRPEDGSTWEFAFRDILKVKEDAPAEAVTLIRRDMKLRISFEGQPSALRKFSSSLMLRSRQPKPEVCGRGNTNLVSPGKRAVDSGTASRRAVKIDDDDRPIGHPERLTPTPHSAAGSIFASAHPASGPPATTTTLATGRDTQDLLHHQDHLEDALLSPPVSRDSGGGRAGAVEPLGSFDSEAGGSLRPGPASPELEPLSSLVVVEESPPGKGKDFVVEVGGARLKGTLGGRAGDLFVSVLKH